MKHPVHHARVTPEKIAYQMAGTKESITFAELDARSNQGAHALRALGVQAGDHIAFLMENRLAFMEICWAAQRSGVVFTPISRYLQPEEAAYIVADCGAKVFITSERYAEVGQKIRGIAGSDLQCLMIGQGTEGFEDWSALSASMPEQPLAEQTAGATMLYSSGTTGRPKGILKRTQSTAIDALSPVFLKLLGEIAEVDEHTVYLSPTPLYHSAPIGAAMVAAGLGATTIIMERFDEEAYLQAIETHRVTHTQVVPTMFVRLLKMPEDVRLRYDCSSLLCALHVAAPCPVDIKHRMIAWWGPILLEYYAGTEGNGVTATTTPEWLDHVGSVGRALVGSLRILDEEGAELPRGEVGNVYFDSGLKFTYHNDPEKTAEAYTKEGWSTLGDIGWLDDDGFLYLTDRKSYTIITGGVNVYPQETEDLMVNHPAVADVAVFGVPNEELGEEVKAVVRPVDFEAAGPELEAELIAYCRAKLSVIKTPKSVDFRRELPRTATGKLIKRHLKAEYWPS